MHAAMQLFVLICICSQAIVMTVADQNEVKAEKKLGKCTPENDYEIRMLSKETKCQPRPTQVLITSMDNNFLVLPSSVTVNRCRGSCSRIKACLPTEQRRVSKAAQWSNIMLHQMNSTQCGMVEVMEHTNCSCSCAILPEDCSLEQEYDKKKCMCKCANMHKMDECIHRPGWRWNQTKCRCECNMEEKCSTPYEWIQGRCACGLVMMNNGPASSENNELGGGNEEN